MLHKSGGTKDSRNPDSALTEPRDNRFTIVPKIYIGVTYPIQASSEGIYLLLNTKLTKIPS